MAKEKKITVKFYLNKERKVRLFKPNSTKSMGEAELHFNQYSKAKIVYPSKEDYAKETEFCPVYVRVTYNRKNTQFKLTLPANGFDTLLFPLEADISGVENYKYSSEMAKKREIIKSLIKDEVKKLGDKFRLSGISDRITYLEIPLVVQCKLSLSSNLDSFYSLYFETKNYEKIVEEISPVAKIELAKKLNAGKEISLPKHLKSLLLLTHFLPDKINIYDWKYGEAKDSFEFTIGMMIEGLKSNNNQLESLDVEFENNRSMSFSAEEFYLITNQVTRIDNIVNNPSKYISKFII